jgi:hypothetical protein
VWTVKQPGAYEIGANVFFNANATGDRVVRFLLNGADAAADSRKSSVTAGYGTWCTPIVPLLLDKGDTLQMAANQTSGGALAIPAGLAFSMFWARFLGGVPS